jgi:hypothetical protein
MHLFQEPVKESPLEHPDPNRIWTDDVERDRSGEQWAAVLFRADAPWAPGWRTIRRAAKKTFSTYKNKGERPVFEQTNIGRDKKPSDQHEHEDEPLPDGELASPPRAMRAECRKFPTARAGRATRLLRLSGGRPQQGID